MLTAAAPAPITVFMDNDFLDSARREEARLLKRLAAVRAVIADYSGADHTDLVSPIHTAVRRPPTPGRTPRTESQAGLVIRIAEEFLTTAQRRAPSAEIYREIAGRGVTIPGQKPESVVSSYLSNSPKFDNVRGQGYGLAIWSGPTKSSEAPQSEEREAPF